MAPALGVVIPTHNRAPMLERALASIPAGIEIVVVDDASSDRTPELLAGLGDLVRHVRLANNRGPGVARNVGIRHTTARHLLFLDDDDFLLPAGVARILAVLEAHPEKPLHLHNCVWSNGNTSIPPSTPITAVDYREWLGGRFMTELKPVARRDVFDQLEFEDTGASGEGLLWGRVIRGPGALVSGPPIVMYDVRHDDRLTAPSGLLLRADRNARIQLRWLELFGSDQRAAAPGQWRNRVLAAAMYSGLSGQRAEIRTLRELDGLRRSDRLALATFSVTPRSILSIAFRAKRALGK